MVYGAKREKLAAEAEKERLRAERAAEKANREPNTLLGGLFGWMSRRKSAPVSVVPEVVERQAGSVWEAMPRVDVDAPPVTPLSTAAAAAAPYAQALAAAAAPLPLQPDEMEYSPEPMLAHRGGAVRSEEEEPFAFLSRKAESAAPVLAPVAEMPRRVAKPKVEETYAAPDAPAFAAGFEAAQAAAAAGSISFGRSGGYRSEGGGDYGEVGAGV